MKLLYAKPSWSCASISDLLAPVGKFQISGCKVVFAMPFQSVSASLRATDPSSPCTIAALLQHMLTLPCADFTSGGGACALLRPGDFLWIPDACLIAEFNVGNPKGKDILTSLTWVAMTKYHCSSEACRYSKAWATSVLQKCCEPSQKHLEATLKARLILTLIIF